MIKNLLKKNKFLMNIYRNIKQKRYFKSKYTFIDRRTENKALCYILAGYKDFLWDELFSRIKNFVPNDIDVCVLSPGMFNEKLNKIAEQNGWSYLSVKRNNVCVAQNLLFKLFDNVELFYKLDEDIFVTRYYFEELKNCYTKTKNEGRYFPGIVCPLIPINGFAHVEILKRFAAIEEYEKRFEQVKYASGPNRMIENNPEVAKFMWGEGGYIPKLDIMAESLKKDKFDYVVCPIRFSIGAIMFDRELLSCMGYFNVPKKGNGLGYDEDQIASLAVRHSKAIIVSKNTIAGHLSFGKQNAVMKNYYLDNKKDMFN